MVNLAIITIVRANRAELKPIRFYFFRRIGMNPTPVIVNADSTYGRIIIYTDVEEVTKDNVLEIFETAYSEHQKNAMREEFLFSYTRGKQPIIERKKDIRPDINEKLVINIASRIVDTHVGYCFGNPITYVQRGKVENDTRKPETTSDEDNNYIAMINKMMAEQGKAKKDVDLARDYMICGLGYQMVWKNDNKNDYSPFKITTLNPRTTFVIYKNDAFREPLMGCTYFQHADGSITATMYTNKLCFKLTKFVTNDSTYQGLTETPNILGEIPIIEFEHVDRMGVFEKVISILDKANVLNSDRINDVAQHVQSLLWLHNCMIDEDKKKKLVDGDGVIVTKSNGDGKEAKIAYLSQVLDQSQVQTFADFLYRQVEEITSTPSWQEASGGSTTGAMQLSNGWQSLELSAKTVEQQFTEPENQILRLVAKVIELDERGYSKIKNIDVSDIEPHFTRNKNYDLVSKTNALSTLLKAGVDGLWAFQTVGLFSDSEQAWIDSKDIIEKVQENLAKDEPKQTNPNNADTDEFGNGGANNDPKEKIKESVQPSAVAQVENT